MHTVALTIDYGTGAQKSFSNIAWKKDLTILEAIQASAGISPGLAISFGSDRSGHVLGLVIDEMPRGDPISNEWVISINAKPFQGRLGTETSFNFHPGERQNNLLKAGDHILVKLPPAAEKSP